MAVAVFVTYLLAARGPGNLFPLSVFDMYQGKARDVVARMLVLDADGRVSEVDAFDDWSCTWEEATIVEACGEAHRLLEYVERDQREYVERHHGDGREAVTLVSRAYRLPDAPGTPATSDCPVARCLARRR